MGTQEKPPGSRLGLPSVSSRHATPESRERKRAKRRADDRRAATAATPSSLLPQNSFQMAPPKATKTAAEKKPAKKTTKSPAGDKKKKVKRSKARMGPSPDFYCLVLRASDSAYLFLTSPAPADAAQTESYKIYIYKVLKQVHPDTGISSKAMRCGREPAAPPVLAFKR